VACVSCFICVALFALHSTAENLVIPFLDPASQSNVVVRVCDWNAPKPPGPELTNRLSNTNLFTPSQQREIQSVLDKYSRVSTNVPPAGSVLVQLYKTNQFNGIVRTENWVALYRYTNCAAREQIIFDPGIAASFRDDNGNGYFVSINCVGNGSLLRFAEVKRGQSTGVLVTIEDHRPQGEKWSYQRSDFKEGSLMEYRQLTNGMILGKFIMWNPINGNLILDADFKEPYDINQHRIDFH
jgi:hypothetical protein